ncbi:helix-turn-helix transcriptional regulator [Aliarcobacter butzleri]|uniref:helix-turn-helix transcriptional regulator n=1 Tax=Aliarcobacter butzleri TaxID=28197 RepID=UPI00125F73DA|nr:WYL domain-containing protein [Aliarcobacter butzleri]MCG3675708.1 WYL domain-containing protein [Aliarcobacter butzleri]
MNLFIKHLIKLKNESKKSNLLCYNQSMNFENRLNRLSTILELLSKGYDLSTPSLVERFGVSKKIIQTDFKEYLLPLFVDDKIYYDYSSKTYKAKNNFLTKTLFSADELSIIAILKNKSKDEYSDENLSSKVDTLFLKFEDELTNKLYQTSSIEKIDNFKNEIIQIKNAVESKSIIKCFYNDKNREIYPLKILNLDGFWYLIIYEPIDNKIKTFHLNTIKNIEVLNTHFSFDEEKINSFDNAITAYYKPQNKPILVQLFLDKEVSRYFLRKPLNKTQRVLKTYDDNSCDVEIVISEYMEIIPIIQRFIPHIAVIEPNELKTKVKENVEMYLKRFE